MKQHFQCKISDARIDEMIEILQGLIPEAKLCYQELHRFLEGWDNAEFYSNNKLEKRLNRLEAVAMDLYDILGTGMTLKQADRKYAREDAAKREEIDEWKEAMK